ERSVLERELVQLREGKNHRVARRETLRDLEAHFEGLEAGARTLLRAKMEGVRGTVADHLEVAADCVTAAQGAQGAGGAGGAARTRGWSPIAGRRGSSAPRA